ncbi:ATP-binding protein [Cellulomonas marina]|uniref:AAA-like domain-containing protein n=1 Tax=Cellulomonas marina TaxID=988821 RepID=A0A1I1AQ79_9CELL|nr:ATP-binding protein [Cellulomonas marina]GIG29290.1 ATP/GTP-binding protein [Cellulomonas marina]SFB40174.1 AAA-like domain-containing protein [Cellulomonas marina]
MRSQITALHRNLLWTRSGTCWALWRLTPLPYGYRTDDKKAEVRAAHTALLRVLRGEALLLGIGATTDPVTVVERMIRGIELEQRPQWAQECEATLDALEDVELGSRTFWLCVPLRNPGASKLSEPWRASMTGLRDSLGMARSGPPQRQIAVRVAQAEQIRSALPPVFRPRPATVAEMIWLHLHAQQRGLQLDLPVPVPGQAEEALLGSPASIGEPVIDPAGQTDLPRGSLAGLNLLSRRYVKIINTDSGQASYQTSLVLTGTPSGGVAFPGGEWLGNVDACGEDVDWALRLNVRARDEVTQRNIKAHRNLVDQLYQRDGSAGGVSSELSLAAEELSAYRELLAADALEVEVEATAIFTVGAPTAEACQASARRVADYYADAQFRLSADATGQEALWWAALPGPAPRLVHEVSQIAPAFHLAAAVPLVTTELGDDQGSLFALGLSNGVPTPVLVDLAGSGAKLDVAMAVGIVGELGSGKSVAEKKLALDAVDRGAELTVIDRTAVGEWGTAVASVPGAVVVDVAERAEHSFDPLRIFPAASGARVAQSFLTALLSIAPTSREGVLLNEVLGPRYVAKHSITSLGSLVRHLEQSEREEARELARTMHVYSNKDFGRAVFDETLPPIRLDAPIVVFWTHLLELPDEDELNVQHRFDQMKLERRFGRAVYALIASIARERCFSNPRKLGVFVVDEAHSVTCSPEGRSELLAFLRDGRKHLAALILGSHDDADFGDEIIRGLIAFRVIMRHRDRRLAARALRWMLGLEPDAVVDERLLVELTENTSPVETDEDGQARVPLERRGECYIRDFRARVGRAKVLLPQVSHRAVAVQTTPGQAA